MINYKFYKCPLEQKIMSVNKYIDGHQVCSIPLDNSNTDYKIYLKWLEGFELENGEWVKKSDGNTTLPADE